MMEMEKQKQKVGWKKKIDLEGEIDTRVIFNVQKDDVIMYPFS